MYTRYIYHYVMEICHFSAVLPQPRIYPIHARYTLMCLEKKSHHYMPFVINISLIELTESLRSFLCHICIHVNGWLLEAVGNLTKSTKLYRNLIPPTNLRGICAIKLYILTLLMTSALTDIPQSDCKYWITVSIQIPCKRQTPFYYRV